MMDEITLRGMRFTTRVGILPRERVDPQPLEIDLTVQIRPGSEVVDYRRLYEVVAGVVDAGPIEYLETAGERIAAGALALPRVAEARVALRKPNVALGGPLAYAEVVIRRGA